MSHRGVKKAFLFTVDIDFRLFWCMIFLKSRKSLSTAVESLVRIV